MVPSVTPVISPGSPKLWDPFAPVRLPSTPGLLPLGWWPVEGSEGIAPVDAVDRSELLAVVKSGLWSTLGATRDARLPRRAEG